MVPRKRVGNCRLRSTLLFWCLSRLLFSTGKQVNAMACKEKKDFASRNYSESFDGSWNQPTLPCVKNESTLIVVNSLVGAIGQLCCNSETVGLRS